MLRGTQMISSTTKELIRITVKPIIYLALVIIFLSITNCANGSNSIQPVGACHGHPLVGSWTSGSDTLTFNEDCTGSNVTCEYKFTWPSSALTNETTLINVTSAKQSNLVCVLPGQAEIYVEIFKTNIETLHIDDGYNYYVYGRKQ